MRCLLSYVFIVKGLLIPWIEIWQGEFKHVHKGGTYVEAENQYFIKMGHPVYHLWLANIAWRWYHIGAHYLNFGLFYYNGATPFSTYPMVEVR